MKITAFFVLLVAGFFTAPLYGQTVAGKWYGIGNVKKEGEHNSYLSEMVLKQKGKKVTGILSYFFRQFTIETKITGTYDSKTRLFLLNAHPLLNFIATSTNGADCPMQGWFRLRVSRVETSLSGEFTAVKDYRLTCPSINIKFSKSIDAPKQDVSEPKIAKDTFSAPPSPVAAPPAAVAKTADPDIQKVKALNERAFELTPVIDVDADSLKVTLYDNGEVDNDTVSVFYNRRLLVRNQMLSDKPLNFTVPLDTSVNEIAMYAENLGKLPPNTALAVIYAGEKRYELGMSSTFIKNSTIRFRKKIKPQDAKNIN